MTQFGNSFTFAHVLQVASDLDTQIKVPFSTLQIRPWHNRRVVVTAINCNIRLGCIADVHTTTVGQLFPALVNCTSVSRSR